MYGIVVVLGLQFRHALRTDIKLSYQVSPEDVDISKI